MSADLEYAACKRRQNEIKLKYSNLTQTIENILQKNESIEQILDRKVTKENQQALLDYLSNIIIEQNKQLKSQDNTLQLKMMVQFLIKTTQGENEPGSDALQRMNISKRINQVNKQVLNKIKNKMQKPLQIAQIILQKFFFDCLFRQLEIQIQGVIRIQKVEVVQEKQPKEWRGCFVNLSEELISDFLRQSDKQADSFTKLDPMVSNSQTKDCICSFLF